MGRSSSTLRERAHDALTCLATQGGAITLPQVLASQDVIPLMGKGWFGEAVRQQCMPGLQSARGGAWRCDRDTFVQWLHVLGAVTVPAPPIAPYVPPRLACYETWLTLAEAATLLRVSPTSIRAWVAHGVLEVVCAPRRNRLLLAQSMITYKLRQPGTIPVLREKTHL